VAELFSEHKHKVNVARFSPNGEWVASGGTRLHFYYSYMHAFALLLFFLVYHRRAREGADLGVELEAH
jgi:hypothetical protein